MLKNTLKNEIATINNPGRQTLVFMQMILSSGGAAADGGKSKFGRQSKVSGRMLGD
jgi:hypothetical protein